MKPSRILPAILLVLTVLWELPVFAQPCFSISSVLTINTSTDVIQDNEFVKNGEAAGNFYCNPLRLEGQPLDYLQFNIQSKGELTLIKGSPATGFTVQIPFYVYLRRNGTMVKLPGEAVSKSKYVKIEISTILQLAEPGDQVILEPANKEDWLAKRILTLRKGGC